MKVVVIGGTGAVGSHVVDKLLKMADLDQILLLGRRPVPDVENVHVNQHKIDIFKPESYVNLLLNFDVAICTLGVGEPSKMDKTKFIKIDKLAVLDFAKACKRSGVRHFELLSSVGVDVKSNSFYLRTKGELIAEISKLRFDQFSVFQPSMILTPTNRYGLSQGVLLKIWPFLTPLLIGRLRKFRGIKVDILGKAIALNLQKSGINTEYLFWNDFNQIANSQDTF